MKALASVNAEVTLLLSTRNKCIHMHTAPPLHSKMTAVRMTKKHSEMTTRHP